MTPNVKHSRKLTTFFYTLEEALTLALDGEQANTAPEAAAPRRALGRIYMGMGLVRWCLEDYAAALERLLDAKDVFREAGDRKAEANVLSNIDMVYGVKR